MASESRFPAGAFAAPDVARRLGELSRELAGHHGGTDTMDAVVEAAVAVIPGAEHASISVTDKGQRNGRTLAATSRLSRLVDQAQYDTRSGPCLDTLYEHVTVVVHDMSTESRWPDFARSALAQGVLSMLSVQLYVADDDLGALNLASTRRHAFTDESEPVAGAFAAHAAVAVAAAQEIEGLRRAVDSRDVIGQAKGILMERHSLTGPVAFSVLVRYSRDTNVKLVEVAAEVVRTSRRAAPPDGEP